MQQPISDEATPVRKRIITLTPQIAVHDNVNWLRLEELASIEITSEDPAHPIENALLSGAESGWRADFPGEQTLRIIFDRPQRLTRILLRFAEVEVERTQEFVLRWSADGQNFHELFRQQWNFGPGGSFQEAEDYRVELDDVIRLELTIVPDQSGGDARASIAQLRLA
jgi:hypothetical protein